MVIGLYQLTKKKIPFEWGRGHQQAFDKLVSSLTEAPILVYPNAHDQFILDTDASNECIGAELIQVQSQVERVVSYGSFVLTPEQRKYCTTRKELLAVVRFTRQFRHYLLGRKFLIRTDHNSLTWLLRFKNANGQLARWLEELSQFDMAIIHRKGTMHGNADGLSRRPDTLEYCDCYRAGIDVSQLPCAKDSCKFCKRAQDEWRKFEDDVDDVIPLALKSAVRQIVVARHWIQGYSPEEIQKLQQEDSDLAKLQRWLKASESPKEAELKLSSRAARYFWTNKDRLTLQEGTLYYKWEEEWETRLLLMVPLALRDEVIRLSHDLPSCGHLGVNKTTQRIKQAFMWYGLSVDVAVYVKSCPTCNQYKKANVKAKAGLGSYHAGCPGDRVHVDILGPFTPSRQGNRYVVMIVDQFTKWLECYPLPHQTAESVAKTVVDGYIARHGCPVEIHTDQGRQFEGGLFAAVCDLLEISKTRTTPYRPCSNGQVERYNRTLLQMIRCHIRGQQDTWDEHLQQLAGAVRATVNRQTGFSANMMMLGREVLQPIDLMLGTAERSARFQDSATYVKNLRTNLQTVHALAREHLQTAQVRQKRDYDFKLNQQLFQIGDVVYQIDSATKVGQSSKLKAVWKGPFLIIKPLSSHVYQLETRKRKTVVHHDRLKLCHDRVLPIWLRRRRHELLNEEAPMATTDITDGDEGDDGLDGIETLFSQSDLNTDEGNTPTSQTTEEEVSPVSQMTDYNSDEDSISDVNKLTKETPDRGSRRRVRVPRRLRDYELY